MNRNILLAAAALSVGTFASAHVKAGKNPPSALKNRIDGTSAGVLYYVGYSHIDFNWLWDWPDTIHTWDSTAQTALNLMYKYPTYTFGETQAAAYLSMERIRPDIFANIQSRVATGQWQLLGGMWDESDEDLPSGEGLARSFLYGQSYFQEKFGKQAKVGFLPDTFGHTRQMPQILNQAEIPYFYFQRCAQAAHLFWWKALDGSKVLAYSSPGWYNSRVDPSQNTWPNTILSESGVNTAMCIYGVGDHGGGPAIQDLTVLDMLKTDPTFPEIRETSIDSFFSNVLTQDTSKIPTVNTDLQYTFEGCYTTHSDLKRILRDSENENYVSETLAALASIYGLDYPANDIRFGWRHSAFNQFHDIAPGTAIHSTYEEAANKQKQFKQTTDKIINNSWATLEKHIDTTGAGTPVTVFNPVAWTRTDYVEATVPFATAPAFLRVTDPNGNDVPAQITGTEGLDGKVNVSFVFIAENMPSLGYRVYHVGGAATADTMSDPLTVSNGVVTSKDLIVNFDTTTGQVSRLFDRNSSRDYLAAGQNAFRLAVLGDSGDAWTISATGTTSYMDTPTSVQVLETGPVRASFLATYTNGASSYTQNILVYRNLDRVDNRMTADFEDPAVFIKSVIPTRLTSPTATFEVPYGNLARPTNGHLDEPMQKWMDESQGTTYGLSVLNDCKYGADVNGATMRQSLLRGTRAPDTTGDRGARHFNLALLPHAGDWKAANTTHHGYEFNLPLRVMPTGAHTGDLGPEHSFLSTNLNNVAVTAFKKAEDGNGYVLRYYEYAGTTQSGSFVLPQPVSTASPVNILEHSVTGNAVAVSGSVFVQAKPYTIQSVRLNF